MCSQIGLASVLNPFRSAVESCEEVYSNDESARRSTVHRIVFRKTIPSEGMNENYLMNYEKQDKFDVQYLEYLLVPTY